MLSFLENVLEVTIAVVLADRIIKHAPDIKDKVVEFTTKKYKINDKDEVVAA